MAKKGPEGGHTHGVWNVVFGCPICKSPKPPKHQQFPKGLPNR